MYFSTKKNSETGKKFSQVVKNRDTALEAQKVLAKKYGFKEWRPGYWCVWGGFSACIFATPPDLKLWKKVDSGADEYMPRLNSKQGKEIGKEFSDMPRVVADELNQCIGFNGAPFKTIGFATGKTEYGFIVGDEWKGLKIPVDCTELLKSEYDKRFKDKK